jgi:Fe-S-cluster containining protein
MLQELALQVLELYAEFDSSVKAFTIASGLRCPQGCGECCLSTKVEVTILELLPLAFHLFHTNQAELLIKRLERQPQESQCLLYRPDFTRAGLWGCSQYKHRGVVCRLFGFAGNRDRTGMPRLAQCRIMKFDCSQPEVSSSSPPAYQLMPLMSEAGIRITALHPELGTERLPINQALYEALQKVGMIIDLSAHVTKTTDEDPVVPPDNPLSPLSPITRRAA